MVPHEIKKPSMTQTGQEEGILLMARRSGIFLLAFLLAASAAVASNSSLVYAQSCNASLGTSSLTSTQYYYNSYLGINTPVSAYCPFYGGQLYAVGDVFDTSANLDLGSVNAMLTPTYGGNTYTGQLLFNLPPSIIGHQLRIMVSVYGGQYGYYGNGNGQLLATAGQMVKVNVTYQGSYPNGNCYMNYNCYGYYPNGNCYQKYNCYPNYCSQASYCYPNYYPTCYYYYDDGYYYQAYCNYQSRDRYRP
jgi:hypothetical protein